MTSYVSIIYMYIIITNNKAYLYSTFSSTTRAQTLKVHTQKTTKTHKEEETEKNLNNGYSCTQASQTGLTIVTVNSQPNR